jgi:hypothetical protein
MAIPAFFQDAVDRAARDGVSSGNGRKWKIIGVHRRNNLTNARRPV